MRSFLLLTQYYPPETGAPQNRLHSLARFLASKEIKVEVFTAMPNYPVNRIMEGYRGKWCATETMDRVTVNRSWIFVPKSRDVIARLLNYFSFVFTSFFSLLRHPPGDYLFCESPPLFLGITAVIVARWKNMKMIFNVSDLWPESAEKLGLVANRPLLSLAYRLEKWIYRNAWLITGQTQGIVANIQSRFPGKTVLWLPNGVDLHFAEMPGTVDWRSRWAVQSEEFVVLYAGILGHAQGLEVIIRAAEKLKQDKVRFVIAGDGPEKEALVRMAEDLKLHNVIFQDNVPKNEMAGMIRTCSAFVVPLRKLDLFKGAIPSKLFEPLALGKPVLLGVEGEARRLFIEEGKAGLFFEPENADHLTEAIRQLKQNPEMASVLGQNGREYVHRMFDRAKIHESFVNKVRSISA